jgi:hypothetical protein
MEGVVVKKTIADDVIQSYSGGELYLIVSVPWSRSDFRDDSREEETAVAAERGHIAGQQALPSPFGPVQGYALHFLSCSLSLSIHYRSIWLY